MVVGAGTEWIWAIVGIVLLTYFIFRTKAMALMLSFRCQWYRRQNMRSACVN